MPNEPQLQASLGEVTSVKTLKDRNWNRGYLALGKVIKVHPKRYTADVQILVTNDVVMSDKKQEGRHACRIGVGNAGYDETHKKSYGEIIPIQKGSIVLVGFLKNFKEKPVILRVFHHIGEELGEINYKNILSTLTNLQTSETADSIDRYINITRTQDFVSMDMEGNFEVASHTKSFFVGKEKSLDDEHFDFEDLEIKNLDQTTRSVEEKFSKPKKYMAVFRDNFKDTLTDWLKIIVDATKTSFRLAKLQQSNNTSTYIDVGQNGDFKLRRQLDTKSFESGQNYSEITVSNDGKVEIVLTGKAEIKLTLFPDGKGTLLETTDPIEVNTKKTVQVTAEQSIDFKVDKSSIHMEPSHISVQSPMIYLN